MLLNAYIMWLTMCFKSYIYLNEVVTHCVALNELEARSHLGIYKRALQLPTPSPKA